MKHPLIAALAVSCELISLDFNCARIRDIPGLSLACARHERTQIRRLPGVYPKRKAIRGMAFLQSISDRLQSEAIIGFGPIGIDSLNQHATRFAFEHTGEIFR